VEWSSQWMPSRHWQADLNLAWTRPRYTDGSSDRYKGRSIRIKQINQSRKVGKRTCKPVYFVDDNYLNMPGLYVRDQALQCWPFNGSTRVPTKRIGKWVLYFIAFTVVMQIIGVMTGTKKSFPSAENKDKKPTLNRIVADCEVNWELAFKSKMRDPDSLDWDRKNAEFGMYKDKTVIAVPYRAKNGMGGMTLDKALCEIDAETREVKAALK